MGPLSSQRDFGTILSKGRNGERIEPMGGENPCERYANFGILCLPQDLP